MYPKPILGSTWLIAEYHVLHRLLLPRHSPNALLALDLIQKEQDWLSALPRGTLLECDCSHHATYRSGTPQFRREQQAGKQLLHAS